jgi:Zn finger protein HypA/HybF involved in hydrogenase expression
MATHNNIGQTPLERLRYRYENTETKCPDCGYVDDEGNWTSKSDGQRIVYQHVCPSCRADHEHVFYLSR